MDRYHNGSAISGGGKAEKPGVPYILAVIDDSQPPILLNLTFGISGLASDWAATVRPPGSKKFRWFPELLKGQQKTANVFMMPLFGQPMSRRVMIIQKF